MANLSDSSTFSSCRPHRDLASHLNVCDLADCVNWAFEVEGQQPLQDRR